MRNMNWRRMGKLPVRLRHKHKRRCNLCAKVFRDTSGFRRFCNSCREESEVFRFGDWLDSAEIESELEAKTVA